MNEITWHYVKTDGNPKKKGVYLAAYSVNFTLTGRYEKGQWWEYGSESENGGEIKIEPYAWAEFPKAPEYK